MGEGGTMGLHSFLCPSPFVNRAMGLPENEHKGKNTKKKQTGRTRKRERIRKSPETTVLNSFKVNNNGRSSHRIMFYKKAVLKISVKFTACNFIKKRLCHSYFL